jgi:hypothetical protein
MRYEDQDLRNRIHCSTIRDPNLNLKLTFRPILRVAHHKNTQQYTRTKTKTRIHSIAHRRRYQDQEPKNRIHCSAIMKPNIHLKLTFRPILRVTHHRNTQQYTRTKTKTRIHSITQRRH